MKPLSLSLSLCLPKFEPRFKIMFDPVQTPSIVVVVVKKSLLGLLRSDVDYQVSATLKEKNKI